jgi:hypothetical protein
MQKQHLLALTSAIFLITSQFAADADPLSGNVQLRSARVSRPGVPGAAGTSQNALNARLDDKAFDLNASSTSLNGAVDTTAPPSPLAAFSGTESIRSSTPLTGGAQTSHATTGGTAQSAAAAPIINDYNARAPLSGNVTFRFCYFDLGDGAECCWEGLRDANYLRGRGVDVAIMLDRGGVRLANKHNGHQLQLHRGSTERMIKTQEMLRQFIDGGGTVFVSERWAREFGLYGGSYPSLTQGVKLATDEEMADLLVERSGRIVEY